MKKITFGILFILFNQSALADWILNNQASRISFVSTKNTCKTESHTFGKLSGELSNEGKAVLKIDLSSVDTKIPARDERMRESLFEIVKFPTAEISVAIKPNEFQALPTDQTRVISTQVSLALHGSSKEIDANLSVTKLKSGDIVVQDVEPVVVSLADFGLLQGLKKLRKIAKLKTIKSTVPISFNLIFSKE
ncbi:MAG: YceI family protein [Methylococcales bacterium]